MSILSIDTGTLPAHGAGADCRGCRTAAVCALAPDAGAGGLLPARRLRVARGEALFCPGEPVADRCFVVHYGVVKYSLPTVNGQHKVIDFAMSGDVLGLAALGFRRHQGSAVALVDSEVCEVHSSALNGAPLLLYGLLSKQIAREQLIAHGLRHHSAAQRLALFLLDQSQRFQRRGYSAHRFRLSMSRQDIASFLALSAECLSRELAGLRAAGLAEVSEREVVLHDLGGLYLMVSDTGAPCRQSAPVDGHSSCTSSGAACRRPTDWAAIT